MTRPAMPAPPMRRTVAATAASSTGRRGGGAVTTGIVAAPAVLAFVLSVAFSGRPSYWLDEAATVSAVDRPLGGLVRLLHHVDAVHGVYYLALWPWARLGTGEVWLRLPSAFAAAGATAAVAGIAWQLFGRRAALLSALLFATLPLTSYAGENARSPALHMLLVAAATFALLRATAADAPAAPAGPAVPVGSAAPAGRVRWWVLYAVAMSGAVAVFLFTVPLLLAHAGYLLLGRHRTRAGWVAFVPPLLAAAAVGSVTAGQDAQINWIRRPVLSGLPLFAARAWFSGSVLLSVVLGAVALAGLVLAVRYRRQHRPGALTLLLLVLFAPPVLLWLASQLHPVLDDRYVPEGTITLAVLAGYAGARLWRPAPGAVLPGVVVVAVVLAGLGSQIAQRRPAGMGDDYRDNPRAAMALIGAGRRPGDVVSFPDGYTRGAAIAYPGPVAGIPDVSLLVGRIPSATLYGYGVPIETFTARVTEVPRVWLVRFPITDPATAREQVAALRARGFTKTADRFFGRTSVQLWIRPAAG